MKMANIAVDPEKCLDPFACKECLAVCPIMVLGITARRSALKFRELERTDYVVKGQNPFACIGCMDCVEVCPTDAIEVKFSEIS